MITGNVLIGSIGATDSVDDFRGLKRGDKLAIKYGSVMGGNGESEFTVTKGVTAVGKGKVERLSMVRSDNPKGVKYYFYFRSGSGKPSFAIGDMGATYTAVKFL
jgi:hypothetical protein